MDTTKITAKVYEPLWINFTKEAASLFLTRDPFLNHIIRVETPRLAEEMGNLKSSAKAKRYIAGRLKSMGKKGRPRQVSIVVEKGTALALNKVVLEGNIVRDAFINRLLMLLRSTDAFLNHFELPLDVSDPTLEGIGPTPTSPFRAMEQVRDDPLIYLREAVKETAEVGLHLLPMPSALHGFSCYMPDEMVPGTHDWNRGKVILDSLSAAIGDEKQEKGS